MSEWKIISKYRDVPGDLAMNVASFGLYGLLGMKDYIYEIEHEDTGVTKTVIASDEYELGERIAEGDFRETDDG